MERFDLTGFKRNGIWVGQNHRRGVSIQLEWSDEIDMDVNEARTVWTLLGELLRVMDEWEQVHGKQEG